MSSVARRIPIRLIAEFPPRLRFMHAVGGVLHIWRYDNSGRYAIFLSWSNSSVMMNIFKNPPWIGNRLLFENSLDKIPDAIFDETNQGLETLQGEPPLVSIVIPALNEEANILKTIHSLSRNKTRYPAEVIVVNNNSTDRTQEVLDRLNVRTFFQKKPGWGPARQLGQEHARGMYVLMADADCFYPPTWVERMTTELMKQGVTCVYGGYSFLACDGKPRWKFFIYESLRNLIAEVRHLKRPWYNSVGMCMGYVRALGMKVGFVDKKIRGEDGRMCYELSRLGKIVHVRSRDVVVWTYPRTLQKDGNLLNSLLSRAVVELARFGLYFSKQPAHDTHTSLNFNPPAIKYFKKQILDGEKKTDEVNP